MSIADKLLLGVNTTVIGMGIVFLVLILLSVIVMIQSKIVAAFFKEETAGEFSESSPESGVAAVQTVDRTGTASGETELVGVEDEETVALIMAVVSHQANIPLKELKIKSIKAL